MVSGIETGPLGALRVGRGVRMHTPGFLVIRWQALVPGEEQVRILTALPFPYQTEILRGIP